MQAAGQGTGRPRCHTLCSPAWRHTPHRPCAQSPRRRLGPLRAAALAGGAASLSLLLGLPALLTGRAEPDLTQLLPVQETRKIPPPQDPHSFPPGPQNVFRDPHPPQALTHAAAAPGAGTAGLWAAVCLVPAQLAAGPPPRRHHTAAPAAAATPPGPMCAPPSAICSPPPAWRGAPGIRGPCLPPLSPYSCP